jgi:hypothetical protein
VAYALSLGVALPDALASMRIVLPTSHINRGFRDALARLEPLLPGGAS